jgi:hypothetical protein
VLASALAGCNGPVASKQAGVIGGKVPADAALVSEGGSELFFVSTLPGTSYLVDPTSMLVSTFPVRSDDRIAVRVEGDMLNVTINDKSLFRRNEHVRGRYALYFVNR